MADSHLKPVPQTGNTHQYDHQKNSRNQNDPPGSRHQCFSARDSILPQEITSSGNPMPRKLSVDSATIAERTFITTINIIDDTKFGARCFHKMCQKLPPMHFAAITYSLLRSCRTSVRIIFAIPNQLVSPMTMDIEPIVAFSHNGLQENNQQQIRDA